MVLRREPSTDTATTTIVITEMQCIAHMNIVTEELRFKVPVFLLLLCYFLVIFICH